MLMSCLSQGHTILNRLGIELLTSCTAVQHFNHFTTCPTETVLAPFYFFHLPPELAMPHVHSGLFSGVGLYFFIWPSVLLGSIFVLYSV